MPLFTIHTNTTVADKPALLASASRVAAEQLGKPESYVMVQLTDGCDMLFAGSDAPLALLHLTSLGLTTSQTEALSSALCDWASGALGVAPDRIYIAFGSPERAMWGWNRSTFG